MKYWINTVSQDHVMIGKEKGFVQAGHGKKTSLTKLQPGDYIIFYSPKTSLQNGKSVQAFTAVARIQDHNVYQAVVSDYAPRSLRIAFSHTAEMLTMKIVKKYRLNL